MEQRPEFRSLLVKSDDLSWINYDLITYVTDRLGHDLRYAIDPAKIKKIWAGIPRPRLPWE